MNKISIAVCAATMLFFEGVLGSSYTKFSWEAPSFCPYRSLERVREEPKEPEEAESCLSSFSSASSSEEGKADKQPIATDAEVVAFCRSHRGCRLVGEIEGPSNCTPEQRRIISDMMTSLEFLYNITVTYPNSTEGLEPGERPWAYIPGIGCPKGMEIDRNRLTNLSGMGLTLDRLDEICKNSEVWNQARILPNIPVMIRDVWLMHREEFEKNHEIFRTSKGKECIVGTARNCFLDLSNNPRLGDDLIPLLSEKMSILSLYCLRIYNLENTGLTNRCIGNLIALCRGMGAANDDSKAGTPYSMTVPYRILLGGNRFSKKGIKNLKKGVQEIKGASIILYFDFLREEYSTMIGC